MYLTYIRRELRRRLKQSLVIALGLALGIALVITVSSASAGVKNAQRQVLHSLYGVGTDMTVTRTATRSQVGPQRPPRLRRRATGRRCETYRAQRAASGARLRDAARERRRKGELIVGCRRCERGPRTHRHVFLGRDPFRWRWLRRLGQLDDETVLLAELVHR